MKQSKSVKPMAQTCMQQYDPQKSACMEQCVSIKGVSKGITERNKIAEI